MFFATFPRAYKRPVVEWKRTSVSSPSLSRFVPRVSVRRRQRRQQQRRFESRSLGAWFFSFSHSSSRNHLLQLIYGVKNAFSHSYMILRPSFAIRAIWVVVSHFVQQSLHFSKRCDMRLTPRPAPQQFLLLLHPLSQKFIFLQASYRSPRRLIPTG